jgi:hypothetical protein
MLAQAEFATAFVGDLDVVITTIFSCDELASEAMKGISGEPTILVLKALNFIEKVDWCA